MEKIIVAFESDKVGRRFSDIIESEGGVSCVICRYGDEIKRIARKQDIHVVVCGYKLHAVTAPDLAEDLGSNILLLVIASSAQLELCDSESIISLTAPVSRADLLDAVRMVIGMSEKLEHRIRPSRNDEDNQIIARAKAVLMDRHRMTEEQAHRFIQKRSMDSGAKMVQTAKLIIEEYDLK